jgi:hypothetical protein
MALPVKVHILELERLTNGHITKLWTFPGKYGLYPNQSTGVLVKLPANDCIFIIPVCIKFM